MLNDDKIIKGLKIKWLGISKNSYLSQIPALYNLTNLYFESNITFFVGENGSGKSTLLEAIAIAYGFNPEGGTVNFNFSNYDDTSELCKYITLIKGFSTKKTGYFLRAESFFNLATKAKEYASESGGYRCPPRDLHEKSHGESFLAFINHYNQKGLYIMDEPEAALSPQRQLTLLREIYKMSKKGSQFIIATHSPILLGTPDSEIFYFSNKGINICEYEDTESYNITRAFVNNRENMLKELLLE